MTADREAPTVSLSWDDSRCAFKDAANWFAGTTALVGDRWDRPGLGDWDVRALVGHTSRSLLTVETYLARPAVTVEYGPPPITTEPRRLPLPTRP